jgi:hypothetical protein
MVIVTVPESPKSTQVHVEASYLAIEHWAVGSMFPKVEKGT